MKQINPNGQKQRGVLRMLGPGILGIGVLFMIAGFVDFFRAFGGHGRPELFWCFFVGMPLIFVGGMMTKMGFLGAIFRYTAGETAPVAKDTFNYTARETKEGVKDIASAVSEGFREGSKEKESVEDRLEKLKGLRDQGLIDAEDYEEQKDRILNDL